MITGVTGFTAFLMMGPPGPGPHGNGWIVTNERYVVMPWTMVTRHGKNMGLCSSPGPCGAMTLAGAAHSLSNKKNLRLKSAKEERERKRELKRSIKNIIVDIPINFLFLILHYKLSKDLLIPRLVYCRLLKSIFLQCEVIQWS